MRSPAEMDIIQVDATAACPLRCGGCTRLVSHLKKPYVMTPEKFAEALDSLADFDGIVGMMGGEPTVHPQFEQLVDIMVEKRGPKAPLKNGRLPIADMNEYVHERLRDRTTRIGLWSSLGKKYYQHFEKIQDAFGHQCVNDHMNPGQHKALLITRKEAGISDEEWVPLRDACWVQNTWSASITPHGAYFCEVAGALDAAFNDGKLAWPVEPGWWKRTPEEFGEQLSLCEHCALALPNLPSNQANADIDLISPESLKMLEKIDSPSIRKGTYEVIDPQTLSQPREFSTDWYLDEGRHRVSPNNDSIKPKNVTAIIVSVDYADSLAQTLPHNLPLLDYVVVVTTPDDLATQQVCIENGVTFIATDRCFEGGAAFNKGKMLNEGLRGRKLDWVLFIDADVKLNPTFREFVKGHVLNPGCLYFTRRVGAAHISENREPNGYFQLWNPLSLAMRGREVSEEFCSAASVDSWFMQQWDPAKLVYLPQLAVQNVGPPSTWNGTRAGESWKHVGFITPEGFVEAGPGLGAGAYRLTDTKHGTTVEVEPDGEGMLPEDVVKLGDDSLLFLGQDIGWAHIHVARWC